MRSQEDKAAENVLKRAELARMSRQLKSRLSKTNLKIKDRSSPSSHKFSSSSTASPIKRIVNPIRTPSKKSNIQQKHQPSSGSIIRTSDISTTPNSRARIMFKRQSTESFDLNKTEDEADYDEVKYKRPVQQPMPPSSPMGTEEFVIPQNPPSTPPQQKININAEVYNTASTNKTYIQNSSSPAVHNSAQKLLQKQLLSTPDQKSHDEGADLLMFLATSPSPVQYKQQPSTPSRSITAKLSNASSSIQRSLNNVASNSGPNSSSVANNLLNINATPGTPMRNLLKTPGFNMNDYVNLFTPSPGNLARTPEQFSKDVNGKLIKF